MVDRYIPGEGCGCARCQEPVPNPPVQTPEEGEQKQADYRERRGLPREEREIAATPKFKFRVQ